ncbi:hypothetical protein HC231_00345 [Brenneria izadpanahii]|uniref:Uncharacterized protein n=1 Tax=Brenneria izadpanahii TaxID=2722756 RepID=A0ABX7UM08_9GAMM|nr:hypothetical protein [Brenneria izadpanahii]QTF06548.1 hypothetical protein HC231_00345 [Brenneria izadpanahii]
MTNQNSPAQGRVWAGINGRERNPNQKIVRPGDRLREIAIDQGFGIFRG